mgnify:CR=1 FL=1
MPGIQRVGDANGAGGVITSGIGSVRINGRPIATTGQGVSAHPCCGRRGCPGIHCGPTTAGGSGTARGDRHVLHKFAGRTARRPL